MFFKRILFLLLLLRTGSCLATVRFPIAQFRPEDGCCYQHGMFNHLLQISVDAFRVRYLSLRLIFFSGGGLELNNVTIARNMMHRPTML